MVDMGESITADLGNFLRRVRERTRPEAVGLAGGGRRRVPGLRREELAALAGLSPTYYTRLEQSRPAHASAAVLRSLANALRLPVDDEAYLLKIGTLHQVSGPIRSSDSVGHTTKILIDSLSTVAAVVVNHRCDIMAWNALYHRLFAVHRRYEDPELSVSRPNLIVMNFLDDRVRQIYRDRRSVYRSNVSYLRFVAADYRDDAALEKLVQNLRNSDLEFATLWEDSDQVGMCGRGELSINHPVVGPVDLMYEAADLHDGNVLKIYHVAPGTRSESALSKLYLAR